MVSRLGEAGRRVEFWRMRSGPLAPCRCGPARKHDRRSGQHDATEHVNEVMPSDRRGSGEHCHVQRQHWPARPAYLPEAPRKERGGSGMEARKGHDAVERRRIEAHRSCRSEPGQDRRSAPACVGMNGRHVGRANAIMPIRADAGEQREKCDGQSQRDQPAQDKRAAAIGLPRGAAEQDQQRRLPLQAV